MTLCRPEFVTLIWAIRLITARFRHGSIVSIPKPLAGGPQPTEGSRSQPCIKIALIFVFCVIIQLCLPSYAEPDSGTGNLLLGCSAKGTCQKRAFFRSPDKARPGRFPLRHDAPESSLTGKEVPPGSIIIRVTSPAHQPVTSRRARLQPARGWNGPSPKAGRAPGVLSPQFKADCATRRWMLTATNFITVTRSGFRRSSRKPRSTCGFQSLSSV